MAEKSKSVRLVLPHNAHVDKPSTKTTALLCSGTLRSRAKVSSIFRLRYYALVAFDTSPANGHLKSNKPSTPTSKISPIDIVSAVSGAIDVADVDATVPAVVPMAKEASYADEHNVGERTVVLVWLNDEAAFDAWYAKLEPSAAVVGTMRMMNGTRPAVAACLGHLPVRGIKELKETLRLDLPNLSAFDVITSSRKLLLASESKAEILRWEEALLSEMDEHAKAAVVRHSAYGRRRSTVAARKSNDPTGGARQSLKAPRFSIFGAPPTGVVSSNKWTYEVSSTLFHVALVLLVIVSVLWAFVLIWLLNPFLTACSLDGGATPFANSSSPACWVATAGGGVDEVTGCRAWHATADAMGPALGWVSGLHEAHLFPADYVITGSTQTCFRVPSLMGLAVFWLFAITEVISLISVLGVNVLNWRVIRRGAKPLNKLTPRLPTSAYPHIDVLICHYTEPAEETVATLQKVLELDYPPSKLHVYICDDGRLKSDFKKMDAGEHKWPTPKLNVGAIKQSGDTRHAVGEFMAETLSAHGEVHHAATEADHTSLMSEIALCNETISTREVFPDPTKPDRAVARIDCAIGFVEDRYSAPGLPTVSYVARLKPKVHHSKSGNINNILYNVQTSEGDEQLDGCERGRYVAIFDNDMQPHRQFLVSVLPLFFEHHGSTRVADAADGPGANGWTDEPEATKLGWVQTPQYFKKDELVDGEDHDPLAHSNSMFMDVSLPGMDGFDSAMFIGTNAVWRRSALDSIGGLQYGTISEDFWTGHHAHKAGWHSAYFRKDHQGSEEERFRLSEGDVPPNVAASLAQRKRWHKGGVELALGVHNPTDDQWEKPSGHAPTWKVSRAIAAFRTFHWHFVTKFSWITTTIPPLIYTIVTCYACWTNEIFIFMNPLPVAVVMLPRLFLTSAVPTLANPTVDVSGYVTGATEFFVYWPVKLVGTLEAFYSKCTGKPAKWGNTGGVASGSIDEIPVIVCTLGLLVSLLRSIITFFFFETRKEIFSVIPLWGFGTAMLQFYWPFARVSIQEYLNYPYSSLHTRRATLWLFGVGLMGSTLLLDMRDRGSFD